MNAYRHAPLDDIGQRIAQATYAFFHGRLANAISVDWAVRLGSDRQAQRAAVLTILDQTDNQSLTEPWRTAWRLIEESWITDIIDDDVSLRIYGLKRRLEAGDRSGALIDKIVAVVAPGLKVSPISDIHRRYYPRPARVRSVSDLFSVQITSGRETDATLLHLDQITEIPFLTALANGLESAVIKGLDIARRLGGDGRPYIWRVGQLHRVYFVQPRDRVPGSEEPDHFHTGIAPSVKLLHATVERLSALDPVAALQFVRRWRTQDTPIHVRLWAAIARDPALASADEIGQFLLALDRTQFSNLFHYPEVAELRARRFAELDQLIRARLIARIRRGPSRDYWRKELTPDQLVGARDDWASRELRRLESGGFQLPQDQKIWLDGRGTSNSSHLDRLDVGFPGSDQDLFPQEHRETRYEDLSGSDRIDALESALRSSRSSWNDDPAAAAGNWIGLAGNAEKILADLETLPDAGAAYPQVWDRFGWAHSPRDPSNNQDVVDLRAQAERVLLLLAKLPENVLRDAIQGLSHWTDSWSVQLAESPMTLPVWLQLWQLGVATTNSRPAEEHEPDIDSVIRGSDDGHPRKLDTLNPPVGRLIEVFLRSCPSLDLTPEPFTDERLKAMRDVVISAPGIAGLIVRCRLIESIGYFLLADRDWAERHLLNPLRADTSEALELWRSLAHRRQSREVLANIGEQMSERAIDTRLDRDTRESLVTNLIVDSLLAIKENTKPVVASRRIQQMLRAVEDEVRAHGANTLRRFVSELSPKEGAQHVLEDIAIPFLRNVWPQERSLATPGVSRAFAHLPSDSVEAFADAVNAVDRFLVPFQCWSMHDYGLYGDNEGHPRISMINTAEKAQALLTLLDHTIGTSESAVIPHDLSAALEQIRSVAPPLATSPSFRRLSTAARRE